MDSLSENYTFMLTTLPEGKNAVGGRWVYAIKNNSDETKTYKVRYFAKGYGQVEGIDYKETFSPTENMTSVRCLMQLALYDFYIKEIYIRWMLKQHIYMLLLTVKCIWSNQKVLRSDTGEH